MTFVYTHLKHRGVLSLKGKDRYDFLQGLITNDVHRLEDGGILFTAFLSPQGRFWHDFFVIEKEGALYLTPEKERMDDLLSKLNMYKLRSDVTIQDESNVLHLMAAFGGTEKLPPIWLQDPRMEEMGYVTLSKEPSPSTNSLIEYDHHRMALGIADGSRDLVVDKAVILEHNYNELQALDWHKGCYLGQELMSRTFHRGLVRKHLVPVHSEGNPPPFGTELFLEGTKVGIMKSSNGDVGLALLNIELAQKALDENTPLTNKLKEGLLYVQSPFTKVLH